MKWGPGGAVQYDLTWFINPNPLPYFEVIALEANFILLKNEMGAGRAVQYAMTWFINPNPLPYFEVVALEHGYIRAEVNATHFHVQVRPRACCAQCFLGSQGLP
jgi:hypothetical protein